MAGEKVQSDNVEQPAVDPAVAAAALLESLNEHLLKQSAEGVGAEALNRQIVDAVNLLNTQLAAHAPALAQLSSELLVRQASGLVAHRRRATSTGSPNSLWRLRACCCAR